MPGLTGVDHHKKWGWHEFPVVEPFRARVLKFRYRTGGGREDLIAFPSELGVYDGADDETVALPDTADLHITPYPQYFRDFANSEPLARLRAEYERQESLRVARLERIAALRKYLFDFGSTEHVGRSNIEGHRTDYLPVLHTAVWSDAQGYGFDKPALQDDDRPWMGGQKLDRDGTRVREHEFRFRVQPGEYDLTMSVAPFNDQRQVVVTGIDGGPLRLTVRNKDPLQSARIKASGAQPVIGIRIDNDYGHFRWISCVEALEQPVGSKY